MVVDIIMKSNRNYVAASLGRNVIKMMISVMQKKILTVILKKLDIMDLTISLLSENATVDFFLWTVSDECLIWILWVMFYGYLVITTRVERATKGPKTDRRVPWVFEV